MASLQARDDLMHFLDSVSRPDQSVDDVADSANLIDTGYLDSFALIQIILYLEERYGLNLRQAGIDTSELTSITGILGVIEHARE
jgi:acyl carrier protein